MTLPDAIARALKYNYDAELSKIEVSLQDKQLDLALTQMLPVWPRRRATTIE